MAAFTDVPAAEFLLRLGAEMWADIKLFVMDGGQQVRAATRARVSNRGISEVFDKQPPTCIIYDGTVLTRNEKTHVSYCIMCLF